ncbi:unnamed protein product [Moneuplotes crassus]|uniref:Rab-GAP TBC domain-containing protein n=1 Tax=Euplotes crassus TaxID=5936 RepID=A0AAD2D0D5_EUPCR|nr:unnamed protein product [Moneuplotes crassus]
MADNFNHPNNDMVIRHSQYDGYPESRKYDEKNEDKERSTLNLNEPPFPQEDQSEVFSSISANQEYQLPKMPVGMQGTFEIYSSVQIGNEHLEAHAGKHPIIAIRMRGPYKQYGVLRHFQLPEDGIKVNQIRIIKRNFYDDVEDRIDEWIFIYLVFHKNIMCMIFQCKDIMSQTEQIKKARLEIIRTDQDEINFERDLEKIERIIFTAVANIDSRLSSGDTSINPDDFIYAAEIQSEVQAFNPFIFSRVDYSNCFSRYPYSPIPVKDKEKDDLDNTTSKLESRVIESSNSWNDRQINFRASSAISQHTNDKSYVYNNDNTNLYSPQNMGKNISHYKNPSADSNFNPTSLVDISQNPFENGHARRMSQNTMNEAQNAESCDKSGHSLNINDKSMTPDYIGDYNEAGIERLASPISIVPSQRPGDLSSVTEETLDGFEQSEMATTTRQENNLNNKFNAQTNYYREETSLEEEEDEYSEESEYTETSVATQNYDNPEYQRRYEEVYKSFSDDWRKDYNIRASVTLSHNLSQEEMNINKFDAWIELLELPNNQKQFYHLFNKGVHPAYQYLMENYPLKERDLYEKYIRILSCIGHWSNFMTKVDIGPLIVFPFVKVMDHSEVIVCETVMTVINHWCRNWFDFHPNPPIHLLNIVKKTVKRESLEVHHHFKKHGYKVVHYAWPMVKTLFSEVFNDEDWSEMMNYLFTYPSKTNLLYFLSAAIILENMEGLLSCRDHKELINYDYSLKSYDVLDLMSITVALFDRYNSRFLSELNLQNCLSTPEVPSFGFPHSFPLPPNNYPICFRYPQNSSKFSEIPRKYSNTHNYHPEQPLSNPTSTAQNLPIQNPIASQSYELSSKPIKTTKIPSGSFKNQESLREQFKIQKNLEKVENHRKELAKIMQENRLNSQKQPQTHKNSYYEDHNINTDDFSQSQQEEEECEEENETNESIHEEVFEHINLATESDANDSIDIEYQEMLEKERMLNERLRMDEEKLQARKIELQSEIRSKMTEIGSPVSAVGAENMSENSFNFNKYNKKKYNKGDGVSKPISLPPAQPLQVSSILNIEKNLPDVHNLKFK